MINIILKHPFYFYSTTFPVAMNILRLVGAEYTGFIIEEFSLLIFIVGCFPRALIQGYIQELC